MKKLVIFDLDGTLLNTIADLAASANYALSKCDFPGHSIERYNFFVGNGINKLLERALPEAERTEENIRKIRDFFIPYYDQNNTVYTTPYPGIPELLTELSAKGMKLAVASNKYDSATKKLVEYYFPMISFSVVLGQRDNVPVKPDPAIVKDIISVTGIDPENILYVGDSGVDMQTAGNAGVDGVGVTWGFRPKSELERFNPKYIVDKPEELLKICEE